MILKTALEGYPATAKIQLVINYYESDFEIIETEADSETAHNYDNAIVLDIDSEYSENLTVFEILVKPFEAMTRQEIEAIAMERASTDMEIEMFHTEDEIRREIEATSTEDLIRYVTD